MTHNSTFTFTRIFLLVLFFQIALSAQSLKEEMRMPWATSQKDFLTDWLVIGGFPNINGNGYGFDYLKENGGEDSIKPASGMMHNLPDGKIILWKDYSSRYNYVNFLDIHYPEDFNNKVAYAYQSINRAEDGKAILSFGSNVGNKIWLNGKLIYENRFDYASQENNHIEIDMAKGENSLLVKSVHGGWTWGLWMRIIEIDKFSLVHDFQLSPSIIESNDKNKLVVKTDRTLNPEIHKIDVQVKVVAPGGEVVAEEVAKRSDEVIFNTSIWNEGVYDICFISNDNKGEIVTTYLYWYKGNSIEKAKELVSTIPQNPKTPEQLIHVMLSELIYDRVGTDLSNIDSSLISNLYSPLMEFEELNSNTSIRGNGFVRLAYRDEIDNTPQFCRVYLPMNYDPNKKWPLVVNLHGYNPANPVYVKWWSIDSRHDERADKFPIIYIEPHGRGNTRYHGMGEKDVLKCVEMAKEVLNIDTDRIYLKGESMGGGGAWHVGTRHTDIFAAVAPVYGGWDYHVTMSEEELQQLNERQIFFNEKNSSYAQADALLTTPLFITHGDIDAAVNVEESRYAVQMLQRWGYDIRYHEYPGYGHEGLKYNEEVISWFLKHKLNSAPRKVRVRSSALTSAKSNWVRILQREDPFAFIEAEVEVLINNTIRIATENVLSLELTPPTELIDPNKKVTVVWNVNDIREVELSNGKIIVEHSDYIPSKLFKNPAIEGPISHLRTTPFALVVGTTSKDELMNKIIKNKVNIAVEFWKNWQKYEPRVFLDTEMSKDDINKYSLILFGDAESNLVTKKLSNNIPLNISENRIEIGSKIFDAEDAYIQMIYPHPNNSERYISIIGATSPSGMYFYNGVDENYDFVIKDGSVVNSHLGFPSDKLIIARGIFDKNWKISEKYLEEGDKDVRAKAPRRKVLPDLTTEIDNLPSINEQSLQSLVGKYEFQPGINLEVVYESRIVSVISPDNNKFRVYPVSDTEFFVDVTDLLLKFSKNDLDEVTSVQVLMNGQEFIAKKIE